MKLRIIITILLMGIVQNVSSFPIQPQPLRKLIIESEYIIYADVIEIEKLEKDNFLSDSKAILVIRDILKGKIEKDTIKVPFYPSITCPAPPQYTKGTRVLAFLYKKEDKFLTNALSYGAKTLNQQEYQIYKKRISEFQHILTIKNQRRRIKKTTNWLVSCTINKTTHWEGIYELSPKSHFISFYEQKKDTTEQNFKLNARQKRKLRKILFTIKDLTNSDVGLIDLVMKKNDHKLLNLLIQHLEKTDIENIWWNKGFIMTRIAQLSNRDDLKKIIQKIEAIAYVEDKWEKKVNNLLKEFLQKMKKY